MKRLRANDSAATSVKVGYRQAFIPHTPAYSVKRGFCFCVRNKKNKNNKQKQDQKQGQDLSTMRHPDTESLREKQEQQEQAKALLLLFDSRSLFFISGAMRCNSSDLFV
ncbi:hypothetical protein H8L47_27485 [Undibacterium sp. NL8W]|uniref:Uncharacterized protein n=1 Tax=Undibacterium umbellatum TaxID=2762300 RepID=A0ABR6ZI09_9BURK|nr:hypothetical protein [Undibacterium umbellatum]